MCCVRAHVGVRVHTGCFQRLPLSSSRRSVDQSGASGGCYGGSDRAASRTRFLALFAVPHVFCSKRPRKGERERERGKFSYCEAEKRSPRKVGRKLRTHLSRFIETSLILSFSLSLFYTISSPRTAAQLHETRRDSETPRIRARSLARIAASCARRRKRARARGMGERESARRTEGGRVRKGREKRGEGTVRSGGEKRGATRTEQHKRIRGAHD